MAVSAPRQHAWKRLIFVVLAGCTKTLAIDLEVVAACDAADVLAGMQSVTLRVDGDALDAPRDQLFAFGDGMGRIAGIPPTENARIAFLARRGSEDSAIDVAGGGGPYDFSGEDSTVGTHARVVVGRTDTFSGTSSGSKPSTCTQMRRERQDHTATRLRDGRVFITGGEEIKEGETLLLRNTELYAPELGTFIEGPDLPEGRSHHSASLLPDGNVLICGGKGAQQNRQVSLASCWIYDVAANAFRPEMVAMNVGRYAHRAVTLDDGRVVIIGGIANGNDYVGSVEIYDPKAEQVQRLVLSASLVAPRALHTATALSGENVLIAGGRNETDLVAALELWSPAGARKISDGVARYGHAAARAGDGRVVIAGGFTNLVDQSLPSVTGAIEIYDPVGQGSLACASELSLLSPRGDLFAVALPRTEAGAQRLLFGGGTLQSGTVSGVSETITLARGKACAGNVVEVTRGSMRVPRTRAVITPLFGGDMLLTGGATRVGADSKPTSTAETYFVPR